jgi:hypothetical protein
MELKKLEPRRREEREDGKPTKIFYYLNDFKISFASFAPSR